MIVKMKLSERQSDPSKHTALVQSTKEYQQADFKSDTFTSCLLYQMQSSL